MKLTKLLEIIGEKMKKYGYLFYLVLIILSPSIAFAANHYVRAGATGSGSGTDWTNAYTQLPATLVRGDSYYIADGNYGSYTFDDATFGATYIYIKKATGGSHGTETGWVASMGDGVATFPRWDFDTDYWDVDGQVGGGPTSWTSGHGFHVDSNLGNCSATSQTVRIWDGVDYIRLDQIDLEQCGEDNGSYNQDVIYMNCLSVGCNYITISNSYIHDTNRTHFILRNVHNLTIEYNYVEKRHTTGGSPHGEAISNGTNSSDVIIRYNVWKDIMGTCYIQVNNSNDGSVESDWDIYGNIFFTTNSARYYTSNGIIGGDSFTEINNLKVYNNTFAFSDVDRDCIYISVGTGNVAENNIFYDVGNNDCNFTNITHDYNWFYSSGTQSEPNIQNGMGDPFIDSANANYRLVTGTANGRILTPPFDIDIAGNTRGSDGIWDRGAFEFSSDAPRNLKIVPP